MPAADGSAFSAPAAPSKPRGGGDRSSPSPASHPAPAPKPVLSSWRSGAGTSSAPPVTVDSELVRAATTAPKPAQQVNPADLLARIDSAKYSYQPGNVAKAEADLKAALAKDNGQPQPLVNAYGVRVSDPKEETDTGYDGTPREARAAIQEAKDARRDRATRANIQGKGVGDVKQMSWEEYSNLSDQERAAIDFNTMLVRAVRRDRRLETTYNPTEDEEEKYDKTVESMLGTEEGFTPYAPETVAVLKQIGYKDKASDLDDFLDLRSAITARDIKNMTAASGGIGPSTAEGTASEVQLDRIQMTEELAASTQKMEEKLVEGNKLLSTVSQMNTAALNPTVEKFGGVAKDPNVMLGFGTATPGTPEGDLDQYFRDSFETLSRKGATPADLQTLDEDFTLFAQRLGDPSMRDVLHDQFTSYVQARATTAGQYDMGLGETKGVDYKKTARLLNMFGLDEGRPNLNRMPNYAKPPKPEPQDPYRPGQRHVVEGGGF